MRTYTFKDFKYSLGVTSTKGYRSVNVSYLFNETPTMRFIFIKERQGINYIEEAKKIIDQEINNGKLVKYSLKFNRHKSSKRPLLVFFTCFFAATALALGGLVTYQYLKGDSGTTYKPGDVVNVSTSVETSGEAKDYSVSLKGEEGKDAKEAKVGEDYEATIALSKPNSEEKEIVMLPKKLDEVTSNKKKLTDTQYTYERNEKDTALASFKIPGKYVYGPINIKLTLIVDTPTPPGPTETITFKAGTLTGCDLLYKDKSLKKDKIVVDYQEKIPFAISFESGYSVLNANDVELTPKLDTPPTIKDNVLIITPNIGVSEYTINATATEKKPLQKTIKVELPDTAVLNCSVFDSSKYVLYDGDKVTINEGDTDYTFYVLPDVASNVSHCSAKLSKALNNTTFSVDCNCFFDTNNIDEDGYVPMIVQHDSLFDFDSIYFNSVSAYNTSSTCDTTFTFNSEIFEIKSLGEIINSGEETPIDYVQHSETDERYSTQFYISSKVNALTTEPYISKDQIHVSISVDEEDVPCSVVAYKLNDNADYIVDVVTEGPLSGFGVVKATINIDYVPLPESDTYILLTERSKNIILLGSTNPLPFFDIGAEIEKDEITVPFTQLGDEKFCVSIVSGVSDLSKISTNVQYNDKNITFELKDPSLIQPGQHILIDILTEEEQPEIRLDAFSTDLALFNNSFESSSELTFDPSTGFASCKYTIKLNSWVDFNALKFSIVGHNYGVQLVETAPLEYQVVINVGKGQIAHSIVLHIETTQPAISVRVGKVMNCGLYLDYKPDVSLDSGNIIKAYPDTNNGLKFNCKINDSFMLDKDCFVLSIGTYEYVSTGATSGELTVKNINDSFDLSVQAKPIGSDTKQIATKLSKDFTDCTVQYLNSEKKLINITSTEQPITYYKDQLNYFKITPSEKNGLVVKGCKAELTLKGSPISVDLKSNCINWELYWTLEIPEAYFDEDTVITLTPELVEAKEKATAAVVANNIYTVHTQYGKEITAKDNSFDLDCNIYALFITTSDVHELDVVVTNADKPVTTDVVSEIEKAKDGSGNYQWIIRLDVTKMESFKNFTITIEPKK